MQSDMGQETQRQDVSSGSDLGSIVLPMGRCSFSKSHSRAARFRSILPGTDGSRSSQLGSETKHAVEMSSYHAAVDDTRKWLKHSSSPSLFNPVVKESFGKASKILEEAFVSPSWSLPRKPCVLLEVYTEEHSPLTEALRSRGHFALRFTRRDGDLSTVDGRRNLWKLIDQHQPLNIWVAPECGPWSGWNKLNQFKSVAMFDKIQNLQAKELQHVELCSELCRFQVKRSRQFHLEQPNGSSMPQLASFEPIHAMTERASFDMCMFGLKHPVSQKFLRKSSQVFSTDSVMINRLNLARCDHTHVHQPIEGSVQVHGQRMPLTRFCASYCKGFASKVSLWMMKSMDQAYVGEHEDMPPAKRFRFSSSPHKRFKPNPSEDSDKSMSNNPEPIDLDPEDQPMESAAEETSKPAGVSANLPKPQSERLEQRRAQFPARKAPDVPSPNLPASMPQHVAPPESGLWKEVFRTMESLAPRVGNLQVAASHAVAQQVQQLVPQMHVHAIFVCRGTERFQLPIQLVDRQRNTMRHTICMHRATGEIHDLGCEEWINLKRQQRIRNAIPSRIMITSFGSPVQPDEPNEHVHAPPERPATPRVAKVDAGAPCPDNPYEAASHVPKFSQHEVCEGWAPPPVAMHGPKYRELNSAEKADLKKLHVNLGHPDPNVLAEHLKAQKAADHVVAAAKEFVCDACVESVGRKHQRPAKLHDARDFNDLIGMDGFYWSGTRGFRVHVFHCIDEASLFHLGRRCETRNPDRVIETWTEFWSSWAGDPLQMYTDPAGEFISQEWKDMMRDHSIQPLISTEAWQRGRIERHGQIIKRMLTRFDLDRPIETIQDFDRVLLACFQAKNSLTRQQGFSPEQIVLGKSKRLPASLTSDDDAVSHSLAASDEPESESFRRNLETRTIARKAFLITDNDNAIRRALLRRSCPMRGPYEPGQLVMYWIKKHRASRQESGRWHGPARVVLQESPSAVWLSHADRLFKCAPESLRPASLREWNVVHGSQSSWVPELPPVNDETRAPASPMPDTEYEPSLAPEPVALVNRSPSITPHSSLQPESEHFPEFANNPEINDGNLPNDNTPEHDNPNVIDLDNPETAEPSMTENTVPILTCSVVEESDQALYDWTQLVPTQETCDVLLAEDGMQMLEEPLECNDQQCFALSIDLSESDLQRWSQSDKPEEMTYLASVGKRARAEVSVKNLTYEERLLFEKAKDAELNCWIQTNALKPILRRKLNPEQILKSRWILTWKNLNEEDSTKAQRKAKARLVVLGFQDPKLCEVARDSPTLTREGRHTVLQTIASHNWVLSSFDIKTAFLRGQSDRTNPLAMEPPAELRKKLNLSDDQVCSLLGNAYGRVDAPLLFYKELTKQLSKLQFTRHPLEPCIYLLETNEGNNRKLHGVLGTHVDDGICGGDQFFHQQLERLKQVLPFGSFKQQKFVFTGIHLEQLPDFSIMASQEEYVKNIQAIDIGRTRRQTPESAVTETELNKLRGLIGSVQYAVTHTRPDMAAKLGEVQIQIAKATVQTLMLANKVLREAQENCHVKICFRSIPTEKVTHVSFGDASFASAKQLSSFQGTLICATTEALDMNQKAPISPLTWISKKIARVVRSTLSAEAFSMSNSVDRLGWMRLLWGTINIPKFNWRDAKQGFSSLPKAIIVTDCKSLFDLVSRTAMPSCEEFRTTLEVLLIRERCNEHCSFRWIPTSLQVADALTKAMDPILLRQVLASSSFQLYDETETLERNAHRKRAVQWFKDLQGDMATTVSHQQNFK